MPNRKWTNWAVGSQPNEHALATDWQLLPVGRDSLPFNLRLMIRQPEEAGVF